jgi:hypothetical protein
MTDEKREEKTETKAAKPGKTPNMRELEARLNAQEEAANERMDNLEASVGDMANNVESILDAIKGMSAQNRGAVGASIVEPMEMHSGGDGDVASIDLSGAAEIEVEEVDRRVDDPAMMQKLERMKFDMEPITIHVHEVSDEYADQMFDAAVNGKSYLFVRNREYTVPRCVVEVLAQAKPFTYRNEEYTDGDGVKKVRYPRSTGLRYPFSVIHDPNPMGKDWLRSVMSRTH